MTKDDSHPAGEREPFRRTKIEMAAGWDRNGGWFVNVGMYQCRNVHLARRQPAAISIDDMLAQYEPLKTEIDIVKAKMFLDDQFNPDKQRG